ncbi:MAG: FKBP-type peptidyl-prolyl cis-trans isomerase [Prevotella sp.]|nr:FKBP-type peptidyl-prolyl cis-trans isomerase [Prevotella sp.]
MKKLMYHALIAGVAGVFASCGNSTPKADLKTDLDSLSYAIGFAQSEGLTGYLLNMGIDSTYMNEFVKGFNEGANAGDDKQKAAYYAGIQIGQQVANQMVKGINFEVFGEDSTRTISVKNLLAGFASGATRNESIMTFEQAAKLSETKMQKIRAEVMMEKYGDNKKEGEKFLAENAKKEGIKTLPSGVQYKVIKEGTGTKPEDGARVTVHYEGKTIDGAVFDSSYERKDPAKLYLSQVIKGWSEALKEMPKGSVWEVYIPQELAYGEREQAKIKPFSTLIFKIELIDVENLPSTISIK